MVQLCGLSAKDWHLTVLFYVQSLTFRLFIHSVKTTDRLKTCSVRQVQESKIKIWIKNIVLYDFDELISILERDFALNHPHTGYRPGQNYKDTAGMRQHICVTRALGGAMHTRAMIRSRTYIFIQCKSVG